MPEKPDQLAFAVTDPPEIDMVFQSEECEHVILHLDIEICKGAGLQILLFRNSILDRSMELSDRYAELFKHFMRRLGRPDLAKRTRAIEKEFGLDSTYRRSKKANESTEISI